MEVSTKRRPLSSAEKVRRHRFKRKTDLAYKQSESVRIEKVRKMRVEKMTPEEKAQYRRRAAERKRHSRAVMKQRTDALNNSDTNSKSSAPSSSSSTPTSILNPYRTKQSFGKAVAKCRQSLPTSPRRRKAVIAGLASHIGLNLEGKLERNIKKMQGLSDETKECVKNFFFRPDISYTMPGMKDMMTIWSDGGKLKLRKHYLTMFLREAYYMYCEQNERDSAHGLAYSTFCNLRPRNVLLLSSSPKDQCKCMTHENFFFKLEAMGITYYTNFWPEVLCSDELNSDCWLSACDECKHGKKLVPMKSLNTIVQYRQWERVVIETKDQPTQTAPQINANEKKRPLTILQCNTVLLYVGEVFEKFQKSFSNVCNHVNTKRIQADQFEKDKANCKARVLQLDFAMGYECEYQNEVQSALWSRSSVTLFTAAEIFHGQTKAYLICSDSKNKDKETILVFVEHLYDHHLLKDENMQGIEEIIWTDGPSSEFKNKYIVHLLRRLSEKYSKSFTWKYFATSHGKGVVDGIGGNCKAIVRKKCFSKGKDRIIVQNADDFAKAAAHLVPGTRVMFISQSSINQEINQKAPFENVIQVPGISRMHIIHSKGGMIELWRNASYIKDAADITINAKNEVNIITAQEQSLKITAPEFEIGDWVAVKYDGKVYPGEVTGVLAYEIVVSVMHCSGKHFKWPERKD